MACEQHSEFVIRLKQCEDSIKELYARQTATEIASGRFEEKLNSIKSTLDMLVTKVNELAAKPAKRWESVVGTVIAAIIGIAIGKIF